MLSDTLPRLPAVDDTTILAPPVVKLLPFTSFVWMVTVEVATPSAIIVAGDAEINVVAALAGPAMNVTVLLVVKGAPFTDAVIVAVPVVTGDVNVAV